MVVEADSHPIKLTTSCRAVSCPMMPCGFEQGWVTLIGQNVSWESCAGEQERWKRGRKRRRKWNVSIQPRKKKQNLNKKFRTFLWARVVRRTDPPDRPVFIWCMTNTLVFSVFLQTAIPLLTKGTKTANTKPATPRRIWRNASLWRWVPSDTWSQHVTNKKNK